jgi:hypothetical protein
MGIQRATFLIGPEGTLVQVWPKVKVDAHSAQVQEALARARGGQVEQATTGATPPPVGTRRARNTSPARKAPGRGAATKKAASKKTAGKKAAGKKAATQKKTVGKRPTGARKTARTAPAKKAVRKSTGGRGRAR